MRNTGARDSMNNIIPQAPVLIERCVALVIEMVDKSIRLFASSAPSRSSAASSSAQVSVDQSQTETETIAEKDIEREKERRNRLHCESFDALHSLYLNSIAFSMLSSDSRQAVLSILGRFCPITMRFYESRNGLLASRMSKLGFLPSRPLDFAINPSGLS
jgi:hypothetical protein